MSFTIDARGKVTDAVVTDAPANPSGLGACVRSAFEGLSFPPPRGGSLRVVYPFVVGPASRRE